MTNPKALRIGNYINTHFGIKKVIGITSQPAKDGELYLISVAYDEHLLPEHCYGIGLTPEILEKCGFIKDNPIRENQWTKEEFTIEEEEHGYSLFASEWTIGETFYFLHQLQNLYFSLTGEELTIHL